MAEDPAAVWRALEQSGQGDGVLDVASRSSGVQTGFGPARYALGPAGERRLLLPCAAGTTGRDLRGSPRLAVALTPYSSGTGQQLFVDILCRDRRLDVVFAELCREILKRLGSGEGPVEAASGTISDFRELLLAGPAGDLTRSKIAGLLGELIVLRRLIPLSTDATGSWTGPYEQRHDFRRGVLALEVKSSLRSDATKVEIHGAEQLLPPAGGRLFLLHVRMEPAQNGALRIGRVFDELVAAGATELPLRSGLARTGCVDPHDPDWNAPAFELEGLDAYEVSPGFPRVTPEQFPGGEVPEAISGLNYSVDLSAARSFRRSDQDLQQYMSGMMQ